MVRVGTVSTLGKDNAPHPREMRIKEKRGKRKEELLLHTAL